LRDHHQGLSPASVSVPLPWLINFN
jgi:hypothetical protein